MITPEAEKSLLEEILNVAQSVPRQILEDFCRSLEQVSETASPGNAAELVSSLGQPQTREELRKVIDLWKTHAPGLSPSAVAWSLRAASAMNDHQQRSQVLDLVWTGPMLTGSQCRRTDQALLELIEDSQESLLIVTYTAYKVPEIANALVNAANRGVHVDIIVESKNAGTVAIDAVKALGPTLERVSSIYLWPEEQRPTDSEGRIGAMHAKCAVADKNGALLSSANLTGFALTDMNMEMGIQVKGGPIPAQIQEHFEALIEERVLEKL